MKCKVLTIAVTLLMVMMILAGATQTFATGEAPTQAETLAPTQAPTEVIPTESLPGEGETESVSEPSFTGETASASDPTGSDVPSESSTSTDSTETTAPASRPTEFAESQPEGMTHSPYYATQSPIDASKYIDDPQNWGKIDKDDVPTLGVNEDPLEDGIDFSPIQRDTTKVDERSYFFTNIAVLLFILAIIGITVFVITFVYDANLKNKRSVVSAGNKGRSKKTTVKDKSDDYRDGF